MRTLWQLFRADLSMTVRNRQALFWRLVFPLIFLVIFGLFNLDEVAPSKVAIVDQAGTETSQAIEDGFAKVDLLTLVDVADVDAAKRDLEQGDLDFVVVIPETLKDLPSELAPSITVDPATGRSTIEPPPTPEPVELTVFYNEANVSTNQVVLNLLEQVTGEINAVALKSPKLFTLKTEALTDRIVRYIDFLMPGILAMGIMTSSVVSTAVGLTEQRERRILKRLFATPLDRRVFVAALLLSRLVLAFVQAAVIIGAAKLFFAVAIPGQWLALAVWVVLAAATFLALGFVVASLVRTTSAAESLSQVATLPMMFLSGVFFPNDSLPTLLRTVVHYLPLTPIIEALRGIALDGEVLAATRDHLWLSLAWIVGLFILSVARFRTIRQ